jgi:hypothetical protein
MEPEAHILALGSKPDHTRCTHCNKPKSHHDVGLCLSCYNKGIRNKHLHECNEVTRWHTLASGTRVRWKGDVVSAQEHIEKVLGENWT